MESGIWPLSGKYSLSYIKCGKGIAWWWTEVQIRMHRIGGVYMGEGLVNETPVSDEDD